MLFLCWFIYQLSPIIDGWHKYLYYPQTCELTVFWKLIQPQTCASCRQRRQMCASDLCDIKQSAAVMNFTPCQLLKLDLAWLWLSRQQSHRTAGFQIQGFPYGDWSKPRENLTWRGVFLSTLRISAIYFWGFHGTDSQNGINNLSWDHSEAHTASYDFLAWDASRFC